MHGRGEKRVQCFGVSLKEKDHLKDQGVDRSVGSKWTSGRLVRGVWSGFTWVRIVIVARLL
jgi:hypothetical protein